MCATSTSEPSNRPPAPAGRTGAVDAAVGLAVACYVNTVEQFVLHLRGRGLMLSPADLRQILDWYDQGIPLRVACQALLDSALQFRQSSENHALLPHTLRYFNAAVQKAGERWRTQQSMALPHGGIESESEPFAPALKTVLQLCTTLATIGREEQCADVRRAYRHAYRSLQRLHRRLQEHEPLDLFDALLMIDRQLIEQVMACLDDDLRERLIGQAEKRSALHAVNLGRKALGERRQLAFEQIASRHFRLARLIIESQNDTMVIAWRRSVRAPGERPEQDSDEREMSSLR